MVEELFLNGVPVEAADRAETASDGGPSAAVGFHVTTEALDVGSSDHEEPEIPFEASRGELSEIKGIRRPGQAAVGGEKPREGLLLILAEEWLDGDHR